MTASVVGAIAPKLEQAEIERAKRKPTESLDAYDYYLRGMASLYQRTKEANSEALRLFSKAIELDPDFASAYGMAAWCYVWRKINGWMTDRVQEIAEAARLARRAVELGKDDAVALARGGHALGYVVGDLDSGVAFIDRALLLNPNLATGVVSQRLGESLSRRDGRGDRAPGARHAPEPARSDPVSYAGRDRDSRISSPAATTRRRHGRKRHCGRSRITFPQPPSWPQAMRWPDGWRKRGKQWHACARSIPLCAFPILRIGSRFADQKISLCGQRACEKQGCRNDGEMTSATKEDDSEKLRAGRCARLDFRLCADAMGRRLFPASNASPLRSSKSW